MNQTWLKQRSPRRQVAGKDDATKLENYVRSLPIRPHSEPYLILLGATAVPRNGNVHEH